MRVEPERVRVPPFVGQIRAREATKMNLRWRRPSNVSSNELHGSERIARSGWTAGATNQQVSELHGLRRRIGSDF
jgi:hypothetical protein